MAFFDKLNQVAKNIGDKTSDAIETTKLNSKISAENAAAEKELKKIGEYYYSLFAESGEAAPEVMEICLAAKTHYDAAMQAQSEIDRIKAENEAEKATPAPAAAAPTAAPTAAPASDGIICPSCGASNGSGTNFCQGCGTRLEAPPQPQNRFCPACGTSVAAGVRFCPACGQKLEG